MNFMQNSSVLKVISILAFVVSALFTVQLMTSGTVGIIAFFMTALMAIILEVTKCGFFFKALVDTSLSIAMRSVLCAISLLLVLASIFASAGYVTNQANKAKNQQVKSSTQFKQANESREIQKQLFEQKKLELAALQENKTKTVADMERIRDSYPKNYITVKENMQSTINKKSTDLQSTIDKKSAELAQVAAALQSPIDTTKLALNDTKGYSSMFKVLAENINKSDDFKDSPILPEELEMWFFIALGVIFELVAILSAFLAQKESLEKGNITILKPEKTNNISNIEPRLERLKVCETTKLPDFQKQKFTVKKGGVIGFKPDIKPKLEPEPKTLSTSVYNEEEYKSYVEYMFSRQKNGYAPGYLDIARNTSIAVEKCRSIKGELQRKGIIKTVGNRTLILKEVI